MTVIQAGGTSHSYTDDNNKQTRCKYSTGTFTFQTSVLHITHIEKELSWFAISVIVHVNLAT